MVKITLITNEPKVVDIVPATMTIREFLDSHNVNYGIGTTSLDGCPLDTRGLDANFAEHGVTENAIVSCLPNKDNGVEAVVTGSACVIKSSLTPEEIKKVKKYHPEYLVLCNDYEPVFAIDIDEEQPGHLSSVGACFGHPTTSDRKATITILLDPTEEDPVQMVEDKFGKILLKIEKLEQMIKYHMEEVSNEEARIKSLIKSM